MTPMQRRACLALRDITFGYLPGARPFVRSMIAQGESDDLESIKLTKRQLAGLARTLRRFRRQLRNPHLLFWSQRVLAEQQFQPLEDACRK